MKHTAASRPLRTASGSGPERMPMNSPARAVLALEAPAYMLRA